MRWPWCSGLLQRVTHPIGDPVGRVEGRVHRPADPGAHLRERLRADLLVEGVEPHSELRVLPEQLLEARSADAVGKRPRSSRDLLDPGAALGREDVRFALVTT